MGVTYNAQKQWHTLTAEAHRVCQSSMPNKHLESLTKLVALASTALASQHWPTESWLHWPALARATEFLAAGLPTPHLGWDGSSSPKQARARACLWLTIRAPLPSHFRDSWFGPGCSPVVLTIFQPPYPKASIAHSSAWMAAGQTYTKEEVDKMVADGTRCRFCVRGSLSGCACASGAPVPALVCSGQPGVSFFSCSC